MHLIGLEGLETMDEGEAAAIKSRIVEMFGDFHDDVIIEEIYFYGERTPATVYLSPDSSFEVAICIPSHQADNPLARLFHLAHELVHCLTPNGLPSYQATVLEEGLCEHAKVYLGREAYQAEYPDFDFRDSSPPGKYRKAFDAVEDLVLHEGLSEMRLAIRNLRRETNLPFAKITRNHLSARFRNSPPELLSSNFSEWDGR
ncbi:hypothetical protein [Rhizobium sp. BK068]|uniref:hypothetical protein n=1 Tax=Rhizobium sp. BK068 TaxID=2512130 RepID=UPI00105148B2|nr:hypothetical protein [Rhizobium sp. BK068]TCM62364.1 hypothetical protein EV291_1539 [Rhizobium sp. BK068]